MDFHIPVMVKEVIELLGTVEEGTFLDATVGGGGHSIEILKRWPNLNVLGIDRDPAALDAARETLKPFQDRVTLVKACFSDMEGILRDLGLAGVRGVLMDLGVSSRQLDDLTRGFSFKGDSLDMRMDSEAFLTADEIVNTWSEKDLTSILRRYGEERWAPRISRFMVNRRPITGVPQLVEVIKDAIPARFRRTGPHPARRTFQALRIAVNREMEELEAGLPAAIRICLPKARVLVLSYHSLEDRTVKNVFREKAKMGVVKVLTRKPLRPGEREIEENPRARSARLRAAERV